MSQFAVDVTDAETQECKRLFVSWFPDKSDFETFLHDVQTTFQKVPKYFTYTDDEWETCRMETANEFIDLVNTHRIAEKAFAEVSFVGFLVGDDTEHLPWSAADVDAEAVHDGFVAYPSGPVGLGPDKAAQLAQFREQMLVEIEDRHAAMHQEHVEAQRRIGGCDEGVAMKEQISYLEQKQKERSIEEDLRQQVRAYRRAFNKRAPDYRPYSPPLPEAARPHHAPNNRYVKCSVHNSSLEHKEEGAVEAEEGALAYDSDGNDSESGDLIHRKVILTRASNFQRYSSSLVVALRLRGPTFNPFHCGMCAISQEDEMLLWKCLQCNVALCADCENNHDENHILTKGFANRSCTIFTPTKAPRSEKSPGGKHSQKLFKAKNRNRRKRLKYMYDDDAVRQQLKEERCKPPKQVESRNVRMSPEEKRMLQLYGREKYNRYRQVSVHEMGLPDVSLDLVFSLMDQTQDFSRVVELLLAE